MTREELYNGVWYVQADLKHPQWKDFIRVMSALGNTHFNGELNNLEFVVYGIIRFYSYCADTRNIKLNPDSTLYTIDEVLDAFYSCKTPKTINYDIF